MGGFTGIAAAARSIERLLNAAFSDEQPISTQRTQAVLARAADFDENVAANTIGSPALSVFIYRIDYNKAMRAAWSATGARTGQGHLPVDLHLLLTPWADNAEFEYRILGKAMQAIEANPILSGPMLDRSADWAPDESVQVLLEDMPADALMQLFDCLPSDYRLSVPYVARIIRIDTRVPQPDTPVTTRIVGSVPEPTP